MDSNSPKATSDLGIIPNIRNTKKEALLSALRDRRISPRNKSGKSLVNYALYFNKRYTRKLNLQPGTPTRVSPPIPSSTPDVEIILPDPPVKKVFDLTPWKVKYNGKTPVRDFIDRIEELAQIRDVPMDILHRNFVDLIAPEMFSWHKTKKDKTNSWPQLKAELLADFEIKEAQHRIKSTLFSIKQSLNETATEFVQRAEAINIKLSTPVSEIELIPILTDGLLQKYENIAISQRILSIAHLKEQCLLLETYRERRQDGRDNRNPPKQAGLLQTIKPEFNERKFCSFCKRPGHLQTSCFKLSKLEKPQSILANTRKTSRERTPPRDELRETFKRSRHNNERIHNAGTRNNKPLVDLSKPPPNWFHQKPKN